jgi:tRNA threonylcarbamoyladenosine biosynthesis protein TsaE
VIFKSNSESETKEIGRRLGSRLKIGDVVCLYGELGSGKTTMVKGIASALGIDERDIASASFVIIVEYNSTIPFYHIDLYRVEGDKVQELGLQDYVGKNGITVIEWAEKAADYIPDKCISVKFHYTGENTRTIELQGIIL